MVTQIIRGQAVSTAIPATGPVATVSGQGAASPATTGQTQAGTPRVQGQGQVKLTLAQLGQLIQVSEESITQRSRDVSVGASFPHNACDSWLYWIYFIFFYLLCMYSLLSASLQKQQVCSGVDQQTSVPGSQQTLTVMVQGQGQTSGQLQVIPQGVTVIPGPGQQLMQAALPSGQMQRFLFTPMASAATPTPSTGIMTLLKTWSCHLRTKWLWILWL